jgi:hypothetical protein
MKTNTTKESASTVRRHRPSDKEQYERFRQAARELGTDESEEEAFEQAFKKPVPPKSRAQE